MESFSRTSKETIWSVMGGSEVGLGTNPSVNSNLCTAAIVEFNTRQTVHLF